MRTVFTLDLPADSEGKYPDSEEIVTELRSFGWELQKMEILTAKDIKAMLVAQGVDKEAHHANGQATEIAGDGRDSEDNNGCAAPEDNQQNHYKRLAAPLFEEMPEVASTEWNYVIFLGYVADDQTLFAITRMVEGQITFRLLHRELSRLQSSTEKMVRKVLSLNKRSRKKSNMSYKIGNSAVTVFERKFDHLILAGRVITSPAKEALRNNLKDFLLSVIPLSMFIPIAYVLISYPPPTEGSSIFWHASLDRGSTALLTTSLVSALGLFQTWFQIKRTKLIDWTVAVDTRKKS